MAVDVKNTKGEVLHTFEDKDALKDIDFYKKALPGADFRNAELIRVRFYAADLSGADLRGATLKWADFQIANLEKADLRAADLSYTNLLNTNLCGADLTEANLSWAVFKGTKYDKATKFPKGFNPQKQEMKLVEATPV